MKLFLIALLSILLIIYLISYKLLHEKQTNIDLYLSFLLFSPYRTSEAEEYEQLLTFNQQLIGLIWPMTSDLSRSLRASNSYRYFG